MIGTRKAIVSAILFLAAGLLAIAPVPVQASEIKVIVDGVPVTSYDIERRAAFLRLQNRKGDLKALASDEMIDQTLRLAEMARVGVRITDQMVDDAYLRFATSNKMKLEQLDGVMSQSGVTKTHFKEYIRAQMGWGQAMGSRASGGGKVSNEQDLVRNMLKKGGAKPKATEYMLQQVIFVVPAGERVASLPARKREADAMRARFAGCDRTREFAKGLLDVTVRDLGRFLEPQLPPEWAEPIKATAIGGATNVRETDKGLEFIGICSSREVSDDRVAELMVRTEGALGEGGDDASKKYLSELREKAKIVRR